MNRTMTKLVLAGMLMAGISLSAQATTITFDGLAGTSMPGQSYIYPGYYTSFYYSAPATVDGFQFSSTQYAHLIGPAYSGNDFSNFAYNGTDYVMGYSDLSVSKVGGGIFALNSFDIAKWNQYDAVTSIALTTSGSSGNTTQTLALASLVNSTINVGNDFTHFDLTGYNNIVSFSLIGNSSGYIAMDNLVVDAVVPEPASLALLGLGLAGLGFSRRKMQKQAA